MYIVIAAFVFVPLGALEPAPGSDFSPLPLDLTAVAPPRSRRKPPNFPVWLRMIQNIQLKFRLCTFDSRPRLSHPRQE